MLSKVNVLRNRPFVQNVLTLASGAAFAQFITLVFSPLITRLYGPEAFGLVGIFVSITTLLTTAAALSYPAAIVLPRDDWDALRLVKLSLILGLLNMLVFAFILIVAGEKFLQVLNAQYLEPYKLLLPLAAFTSLLSIIVAQWLIRKRAFSITAKYGVVASLVINILKFTIGLLAPSALALIVTNIVGLAFGAILTLRAYLFEVGGEKVKPGNSSHDSIFKVAVAYRDFPYFRMPQNLINAFSYSLPMIMIAAYSGVGSVGYYSLALMILSAPASLVGGAVMSVFYPKVAEAIRAGADVQRMIVTTTFWMAMVGVLPYLLIVAFGPSLFSWAFGLEWSIAGEYSQWLALWLFFQFINKPAVAAVPALRLQSGFLVYELLSTSAKVLALYICLSIFEEVLMAVAIYSVVGAVAYIWLIIWIIQSAKLYQYISV
ncbi:lipopolysaccharide biosynthesis protein [Kineobactrum salinum]|uniref:Oligosaccharide flippase family protein n=1 Tax=Kineobactrum salinum TaxID=2708301 RepID=A0A6C0U2K6_9GAMM|nr:oligosaccharide flippase family protein [Kineobactrum salinum]QIB66158.1 oligosaccharide flippase family protein [Kineobactrum salinum]